MGSRFSLEAILTLTDNLTGPYRRTTNQVNAMNGRVGGSFRSLSQNVARVATGIAVGMATAISTVGVATVRMVNDVATAGDEVAKTSRQIGITAEALQELRFAADRQGVSNETLTKSLQLLNKSVGEVMAGQGTLTTFLGRTNPALLDQLKMVENTDEAFNLLLGEINSLPNQMQRAALAQAAFGRSGQDMLKLLEAGPDGIAALRDEARRYGVMSTEAANNSEQYVDALTNLKAIAGGLKITLATQLIPQFTDVIGRVNEFIVANRELIGQKVRDTLLGMGNAFMTLANFIRENQGAIKLLVTIYASYKAAVIAVNTVQAIQLGLMNIGPIIGFIQAIMSLAKTEGLLTTAQYALNLAMSANPIGLIVAAVTALIAGIVLLIAKWKKFKNEFSGASLGDFLNPFSAQNRENRQARRQGRDARDMSAVADRQRAQEAENARNRAMEDRAQRHDIYMHGPAGTGLSTTPGGLPSPAVALGAQ